MKHKIFNGRLSAEERETVLVYSDFDRKWRAETSVPKHYRKFIKQKWIQTGITTNENGDFVAAEFETSGNGVSIRNPISERPPMSDELKQKLAEGRKNANQAQN